jgi:hypothetical protein
MRIDDVFAQTFQWLSGEVEVEWTSETEEGLMLQQGRLLAQEFDAQFGDIEAEALVAMRTEMVDTSTGAIILTNGLPASLQCTLDLVSQDSVIFKLKTASRSISQLEYDWSLDLQRYAYEQLRNQSPVAIKVVNLVRTKKPKMQVLSAPEPHLSRTLAICEAVIASINALAFYPNAKNVYGCHKCVYSNDCETQW